MKTYFITMLCNLILLQSCIKKKDPMTQENFPYMVTVTSPHEYPIEVHLGYLSDEKKQMICGVPKAGMTTGSWQYDGAEAGQGGSTMPSHLSLIYVAYAEKKFYEVDAELPKDKILEAFRKGFMVEGTEEDGVNGQEHYKFIPGTYDRLTIGAAPGGVVVVWLSGNHHRTEICRLQAKETFVDVNDFYDNPHERTQQGFFDELYKISVPDSIQNEIKEKGIPYGLWDKYRDRYHYRFVLQSYDNKDKFTHNYYLYFNGEADEPFEAELDKKEYFTKGIPYNCTFIFKTYSTELFFNDREMLEIFNKFRAKYSGKPMDIIIKPTFQYNNMKVSVKCENEEIPLQKAKVEGVWGG